MVDIVVSEIRQIQTDKYCNMGFKTDEFIVTEERMMLSRDFEVGKRKVFIKVYKLSVLEIKSSA